MKKATAKVVGHPTYADMIKEAIITLKERGGSSLVAIKKFMGQKFKLPIGWEKKLSLYLKKMTLEGKLIKVKGSWKLGLPEKKAAVKPKKVVPAVKPKAKGKVTTSKKVAATPGKKLKKVVAAKKAAVVKKRGVVKPKAKATTKKTVKTPKSVAKPAKKAKTPVKKKGAAAKKN